MESFNIAKITILRSLKSKDYWIQVIFLFIIGSILISQFKGNQLSEVNQMSQVFLVYLVAMFSISFFSMISVTVNSSLSIAEKSTRRMEYYLANGVSIFDLFKGYTLSTFIVSIVPTYCIITVLLFMFKDIVQSSIFIYLLVLYPIFCLILVGFMNIIIFSLKNLSAIRNILFIMNFGFLYLGGFVAPYATEIAVKFKISMNMIFNIGILIISIILFIVSRYFYKKLNNETIIQSTC